MLKKYLEYIKDNPKGYWFKRRLFGWGWIPVKWQGWLVVVIGVSIFTVGYYIGETDDAPGMILISFLLAIAIFLFFGYWKGEKPRWQWGLENTPIKLYQCPECKLHYKDKAWAEKCEAWCSTHNSCNIAITAHAEETKKSS